MAVDNLQIESIIENGRDCINRGDLLVALEIFKAAIAADSENYDGWFYLAFALQSSGLVDESVEAYKIALSINSKSASVCRNLGFIFCVLLNKPKEAYIYYKKWMELEPENREASIGASVSALKSGDYANGWKLFEKRPSNDFSVSALDLCDASIVKNAKLWDGVDISNETLCVFYDGGFGDTIMFSRFVTLLVSKCKKVLLLVQKELVSLFKSSDLSCEVLKSDGGLLEVPFDYYVPIMSLPYVLGLDSADDFVKNFVYIKPDVNLVEDYNKALQFEGLKVGFNCSGNTTLDLTRVYPKEMLAKLFEADGAKFYSLQKDVDDDFIEYIKGFGAEDLGSGFEDFSNTAAAISNLDLVITNDTSVAHLAGAMGKKCFLLLSFSPDWRWGVEGFDSVWYESVKLFRQKTFGDWEGVFTEVREELLKIFLNR